MTNAFLLYRGFIHGEIEEVRFCRDERNENTFSLKKVLSTCTVRKLIVEVTMVSFFPSPSQEKVLSEHMFLKLRSILMVTQLDLFQLLLP